MGHFRYYLLLSSTRIHQLFDPPPLWTSFFCCVLLLRFIFLRANFSDLVVVMGQCKTIFCGFPAPNTTKWHITPTTHESGTTVFASQGAITASLSICTWQFHHGVLDRFIVVPTQVFQFLTHQRLHKQSFVLNNVQGGVA